MREILLARVVAGRRVGVCCLCVKEGAMICLVPWPRLSLSPWRRLSTLPGSLKATGGRVPTPSSWSLAHHLSLSRSLSRSMEEDDDEPKPRVLITGGAGQLGRKLASMMRLQLANES